MRSVLILGGGLAGLSAATALASRGYRVTILEARPRLGGRASSFTDTATGQLIDACQHVSMGCCTNFAHFADTIGITQYLKPQPTLYFMTPDGRVSRFAADALPAPCHLARSFATAHYLSPIEKLRIAWGLACLAREPEGEDVPFLEWLRAHRQTQRTIDRFWGLVLVSALNEAVDRIGSKYARKVFRDGFLRHRRGFEVQVPTVPLSRLYGSELRAWMDAHGVDVALSANARDISIAHREVRGVRLRDARELSADVYVAALPADRLLSLLPESETAGSHIWSGLRNLAVSPITSVHLWFDRRLTAFPHVVLIDCVGQWVFNRGETTPGEFYVQVVVSAARSFSEAKAANIQRQIVDELAQLFPVGANLLRSRVVTEHAATFSAVPGVDRWRPGPVSPLSNLLLAGDWTDTGWPATMEGAVRSGYRAAEAILARDGRPETIVQPDLQ
ncbi:MAG: hydroxysqualene dehydroxylase HpnE [Gemmataceae bacterium]